MSQLSTQLQEAAKAALAHGEQAADPSNQPEIGAASRVGGSASPAAGSVADSVGGATHHAADRVDCLHCELPLPVGRPYGDFCCNGCRAVHGILHADGLVRYYDLGGAQGRPVGAVPGAVDVEWIDDLEQQALAGAAVSEAGVSEAGASGTARSDAGAVRCSVDVQGIHCAACVWLLQELWQRTPGALRLDLNPSLGRAEVVYESGSATLAEWSRQLGKLGYRLGPPGKPMARGSRGLLIRAGICSALAMNAMMFAFSGYFGLETGALAELFNWLAFALATAATLIGGPVFFRSAWTGLRRRVLHLDLPISLGILLAYGASAFGFLSGVAAPYFDTVTIFVALMLLGRYAQRSAVQRNRDYLLAHDGAEHVRARRVQGGQVRRVPVRELRVGDELLLAPGDLVPADVVLCGGSAPFSLDWINGESRPRDFGDGDTVPAGAFLGSREPVRAQVARDAEASGLLRLLAAPPRHAEDDDAAGAATEAAGDDLRGRGRFWSLVNRTYVAAVLVTATLVGLGWLLFGDDPMQAVSVTTAVLVVTCPCALGLATPLAFDLTVAGLREAGIFVRGPALLEKARHVRKVVFDKTGTLTWGGVQVVPVREPAAEQRDVLYTMAASSNHPVSVALAERLQGEARLVPGLQVVDVVGSGVLARSGGVDAEGGADVEYRLGSQSFALGDRRLGGDAGLSVFTCAGQVAAVFAVEEDFRRGAAEEIAALRERGLDVRLLSGDRPERVARAAEWLGLPAHAAVGGLSPEDKAERLRALDAADTMMIGDGLNDAPAFEAAFCAGTPALDRPVMPSRADFFYTGMGTGAVRRTLVAAHRFHRVVATNLTLAAIYNVGAVALAAAGLMTPLLCAVLMPLSSVLLVGHTAWALAPRDARRGPRPSADPAAAGIDGEREPSVASVEVASVEVASVEVAPVDVAPGAVA